MKQHQVTRRSIIKAGAGLAGLAALGTRSALAADTRLRMFWWGTKERADRTEAVNKLYSQRNPGVTIDGETVGWNDYWPRLATQSAGRNAADIIQMDYRYIFEYARRGALLPLDPFVGKGLNLGDFSAAAVDSGKVDGKIYGVSLGLNSVALVYDKQLIESLGLKPPSWPMSWKDFGDLAAEITKAAKKEGGYAGIQDGGGYEPALESWMRQRGLNLYTQDGKLGFTEKDLAEFLAYWSDLRKRKACVAPDVQALDKLTVENSMLSLGKAAMAFANSNQLVAYQAINKSKLGITMYPSGGPGAKPGQYLKPSQLWSVSGRAKDQETAVKVVDFFVSNPDAGLLLGAERGIPASSKVLAAVEPTLDELGKEMSQYITFISDKVGDLPPPPPQGAGEIQSVLRRVNEQVGFGKLSETEAAKQFFNDANAALSRG